MAKTGYVYIVTNRWNTTLYTGVTSALHSRIRKHREKVYPYSFSARYNLYKLVYFEKLDSIVDAIKREKQVKAGSRAAKIKLITSINPEWKDLWDTI